MKLINNLLKGEFTPTNYSKARFEQKVKAVEEGLEEFSEKGKYEYFALKNKYLVFCSRR